MQRLRGLTLLGTAILGESRYIIVQDTGAQSAGRPSLGQASQTMRFKMGDTFEGSACLRSRIKTSCSPMALREWSWRSIVSARSKPAHR